jgi:hypothetical protein
VSPVLWEQSMQQATGFCFWEQSTQQVGVVVVVVVVVFVLVPVVVVVVGGVACALGAVHARGGCWQQQ